jgi:hypothetical protein
MIEQNVAAAGECRRQQENRGNQAKPGHQTGPVARTAMLAGLALRMLKMIATHARHSALVGLVAISHHKPDIKLRLQCLSRGRYTGYDRWHSLS